MSMSVCLVTECKAFDETMKVHRNVALWLRGPLPVEKLKLKKVCYGHSPIVLNTALSTVHHACWHRQFSFV
jgi:hypothetical protein